MGLPHFILLYVDEPQASAEFYARLLDRKPLDLRRTSSCSNSRLTSGLGSGLAVTSSQRQISAADTGELAMAVATNEEVEALCAERKRKGAAILQEPTTMDFLFSTFLAADPYGHRLRVFCPAP